MSTGGETPLKAGTDTQDEIRNRKANAAVLGTKVPQPLGTDFPYSERATYLTR